MDFIATPWQVTLGGVSLLDWVDLVTEEPKRVRTYLVQRVEPIRAANPVFIPRGNVSYTISYTRVIPCALATTARRLVDAKSAELDGIAAAAGCVVQYADSSDSTTLAGSVITPGGFKAWVEGAIFYASYEITGGAIQTADGPPNPAAGANWPEIGGAHY
jgi:hypothetical protein